MELERPAGRSTLGLAGVAMRVRESIIRRLDAGGVPLLAVRLLLGGLFVYTGWVKLGDPFAFLKQIHLYNALPESPAIFINSVAIVLPWLEIIAGVSLILGVYLRGAAATTAIMLAVFTPVILLRALAIRAAEGTPFMEIAFDCGCGTGEVVIWQKLSTNSGLFLLAVYALISRSRRFSVASLIGRRRGEPDRCGGCGKALSAGEHGLCGTCAGRSTIPA
ncbi:MAG: DoxX family protein, partial [Phycisphaerae bacterium]